MLPQKEGIPSYGLVIENFEIKVVEDRNNEQLILQAFFRVSLNDQEYAINTVDRFPSGKNKANVVQAFSKKLLRMMMQKILTDFTTNG